MEFSLEERPGAGTRDSCMIATLRVQGRLIGIDGRYVVQAIVVPPTMTAPPRRAAGVVGIVSHGTQLVPVVHLQRWLEAVEVVVVDGRGEADTDFAPPCAVAAGVDNGLAPAFDEASRDARIVILAHEGQVVGLLVDAVLGLKRCARHAVERLFHEEGGIELFTHAALLDASEPPLPLIDPPRLAALAGAWCGATPADVGTVTGIAGVDASAAVRRAPVASVSFGVFRIGDALAGIPSDDIGELLRTPALRAPPLPHAGVRGLCDWRGQLLPVVDLSAALRAVPDAGIAPWMCVVRHDGLALGVLVHENFGLTAIDVERLDAATAMGGLAATGTLARCDIPIDRGILQVLDPRTLMSHCPESALSARRTANEPGAAQARSVKPYMVFEAAGVFASEVALVQEVLPFPDALRARLAAALPASLAWRGHAVPVRDVLGARGVALAVGDVRQLIVVADRDRRIAVPIAGVRAMIPAHTGTLCRLFAAGREVEVVSTMTAEHRASYALVDFGACLQALEALPRAA